jgi:predicted transcriptional regulator
MLEAIGQGPTDFTRILFGVSNVLGQGQRYLKNVVNNGLFTFDPANNIYSITAKGMKYIDLYDSINIALGESDQGTVTF